jgi:hypothetical protein
VAHSCNTSPQEAKEMGAWVWGQPGLCTEKRKTEWMEERKEFWMGVWRSIKEVIVTNQEI